MFRSQAGALAEQAAAHLERGDLPQAEAAYRKLLESWPRVAEPHFRLGNVLLRSGRLAEAEASYRAALEIDPDYVKAWYNLGNTLWRQSRRDDAEACYHHAVDVDPDFGDAHINLGVVQMERAGFAEAEASYRRGLECNPRNAAALVNLGVALKAQGRLTEAADAHRAAINIAPTYADAHNALGNVLHELGRLPAAEASYRKALELKPRYAEAHNNLGITLKALGRLDEAEAAYRSALGIKPDYTIAWNNLGVCLRYMGRHVDAEAAYRKVLELAPDSPEAHNNLGGILADQGRPAEAAKSFRRALELRPGLTDAHSNLLFAMNYGGDECSAAMLEEARRFGHSVAAKVGTRFTAWTCAAQPKKLRIGLVSGDLCAHPVGYFLEGLLATLDAERIELVAYPTQSIEDATSARIRACVSAWRPITGMSDEAAARHIHADGIHVLLDLAGHTTANRLPVFAWKPAPVQATWLGYFATTGVAEIDYLLADHTGVPETHRNRFTETICYLPDTRLCFTSPASHIQVSALPALRNGLVTFGCFQNLAKVTDGVLAAWAMILRMMPAARLRIQHQQLGSPTMKATLMDRILRHGISRERVSAHPGTDRESYLAAHSEVDIILDTFPYPGGTTTCEALWMGVPTLTLAGTSMIQRQGASLMTAAGLPDWVANSEAEYATMAINFAKDLPALSALRQRLRQQVLESPLFDAARFARHLEDALWRMWNERGPRQLGSASRGQPCNSAAVRT